MDKEIKEGTILVCISKQATACGIVYLLKDSIVECASDCAEYKTSVYIYRNKKEKEHDDWKVVNRSKLRRATTEEEEMYNSGKYFLEQVESN